MGFKQSELNPPGVVSTITPAAKDVRVKAFQIARTDTTQVTKAWLPANSSILNVSVRRSVTSDGETASVSVGYGSTTNNLINALTVKTAGLTFGTLDTVIAQPEGNQPGEDIKITAVYTETGTASTTGGPFVVMIQYVN
jgi:hypothetical protein